MGVEEVEEGREQEVQRCQGGLGSGCLKNATS